VDERGGIQSCAGSKREMKKKDCERVLLRNVFVDVSARIHFVYFALIHISIYVYVCVYVYAYICICTYIRICTVCVYVCVFVNVFVYIYIYIHILS
jgi:hypothetical protein